MLTEIELELDGVTTVIPLQKTTEVSPVSNLTTSTKVVEMYAKSDVLELLVPGVQGANGIDGTNGTNGLNGSTTRTGSGAPSDNVGVNGDLYLNTINGDLYEKANETYTIVGNLKGPAGSSTVIIPISTPSTVWTVTHGLGSYPAVSTVDSAGSEVYGDVHYVSNNQLTVTFFAAFSGVVYLN